MLIIALLLFARRKEAFRDIMQRLAELRLRHLKRLVQRFALFYLAKDLFVMVVVAIALIRHRDLDRRTLTVLGELRE